MDTHVLSFIDAIYKSGKVVGRDGQSHDLHDEIDREEGNFLRQMIEEDTDIRRTLEVGCAFGLSSLFICGATSGRLGASHSIIDPFQMSDWHGVGVTALEAAGLRHFSLIEEKSEFALPDLLRAQEGAFDFIFIDGFHTFDHTLLDCFYATRLLRVGGILAIDDVAFNSIHRAVGYLSQYPCYERCGEVSEPPARRSPKIQMLRLMLSTVPRAISRKLLARRYFDRVYAEREVRMVAFRKVAKDERRFDWHEDDF